VITPLVNVLGLVNTTLVVPSLQIVCEKVLGITCGVGLTVTVTDCGGPSLHPFSFGVIVYVTIIGASLLLVSVPVMLNGKSDLSFVNPVDAVPPKCALSVLVTVTT
jgi:hypothetical protein